MLIQISAPPVTLFNLVNLSKCQFPSLKNGDNSLYIKQTEFVLSKQLATYK